MGMMESLINLENYKGQWCQFISKFCQEGFCADCQIYKDEVKHKCRVSQEKASANAHGITAESASIPMSPS